MHKRRTKADIIHGLMLNTNKEEILRLTERISGLTKSEPAENQILALASLLLVLIDKYGLNYIDVLMIADSTVFSLENNNMSKEFKSLYKFSEIKA